MSIADDIEALVARRAGLTEAEMAETLFGPEGYQQRVNSTCHRLIRKGRLIRRGKGGAADPYTYSLNGTQDVTEAST